jgi:hypothetical protein
MDEWVSERVVKPDWAPEHTLGVHILLAFYLLLQLSITPFIPPSAWTTSSCSPRLDWYIYNSRKTSWDPGPSWAAALSWFPLFLHHGTQHWIVGSASLLNLTLPFTSESQHLAHCWHTTGAQSTFAWWKHDYKVPCDGEEKSPGQGKQRFLSRFWCHSILWHWVNQITPLPSLNFSTHKMGILVLAFATSQGYWEHQMR